MATLSEITWTSAQGPIAPATGRAGVGVGQYAVFPQSRTGQVLVYDTVSGGVGVYPHPLTSSNYSTFSAREWNGLAISVQMVNASSFRVMGFDPATKTTVKNFLCNHSTQSRPISFGWEILGNTLYAPLSERVGLMLVVDLVSEASTIMTGCPWGMLAGPRHAWTDGASLWLWPSTGTSAWKFTPPGTFVSFPQISVTHVGAGRDAMGVVHGVPSQTWQPISVDSGPSWSASPPPTFTCGNGYQVGPSIFCGPNGHNSGCIEFNLNARTVVTWTQSVAGGPWTSSEGPALIGSKIYCVQSSQRRIVVIDTHYVPPRSGGFRHAGLVRGARG